VPEEPRNVNSVLAEFQAYLETLAAIQVSPRLRSKFGWSDIIQKTLVEAFTALSALQSQDEPSRRRYLRRMLLNNLRDEIARYLAAARNVEREQPLLIEAEASSCRVGEWLAREEQAPLSHLVEQEQGLRLLEALAELPENHREAIVLQRFHGWKLHEIAEHLKCTIGAVAGYQVRGLQKLRESLPELE
jgi:RNA polymerase sigma-70 factor (subfamily 1)